MPKNTLAPSAHAEKLRDFRENYLTRTLDDLETTAASVDMNVLELFKLVHPSHGAAK